MGRTATTPRHKAPLSLGCLLSRHVAWTLKCSWGWLELRTTWSTTTRLRFTSIWTATHARPSHLRWEFQFCLTGDAEMSSWGYRGPKFLGKGTDWRWFSCLKVGILRPDWLLGATWLREEHLPGNLTVNVWTKADFITYYRSAHTHIHTHTQMHIYPTVFVKL
jgi:hypothetical protein